MNANIDLSGLRVAGWEFDYSAEKSKQLVYLEDVRALLAAAPVKECLTASIDTPEFCRMLGDWANNSSVVPDSNKRYGIVISHINAHTARAVAAALATPPASAQDDGPEFTISDPDLDALLNAAADYAKGGQNMDTGLHLMSLLERVEARLAPAQVEQEPALYQSRMRPNWLPAGEGWQPWAECGAEHYEAVSLLDVYQDWQYQTRKLYTRPQAAQVEQVGSKTLAEWRSLAAWANPPYGEDRIPELVSELCNPKYVTIDGKTLHIMQQAAKLLEVMHGQLCVLRTCPQAAQPAAAAIEQLETWGADPHEITSNINGKYAEDGVDFPLKSDVTKAVVDDHAPTIPWWVREKTMCIGAASHAAASLLSSTKMARLTDAEIKRIEQECYDEYVQGGNRGIELLESVSQPAAQGSFEAGYEVGMCDYDEALAASCIRVGIADSQYEALCNMLEELKVSRPKQPAAQVAGLTDAEINTLAMPVWEYYNSDREDLTFELLRKFARAILAAKSAPADGGTA